MLTHARLTIVFIISVKRGTFYFVLMVLEGFSLFWQGTHDLAA